MNEKDMVMDILSGTKASIGTYAKCITECANPTLRQMLQQMRDADEKFQFELFNIAVQKGFYVLPPKAQPNDVQKIKDSLAQSSQQTIAAL